MPGEPIWRRLRGFCGQAALRGGSRISSIILSGGDLLGAHGCRHPVTLVLTSAWFAIEEKAGSEFLNALSNAIRDRGVGPPATMGLPTVEPTGFCALRGRSHCQG